MRARYVICILVSLILLSGICRAQATAAICKTFGQSFEDSVLADGLRQREKIAFEQHICGCLKTHSACGFTNETSRHTASLVLADLEREWPKRDGAGVTLLSDEILFVVAAEPSLIRSFVSTGETYQTWLDDLPTRSFTDYGDDAKSLEQARKDTIRSLKSQAAARKLVKVLSNTSVRVID